MTEAELNAGIDALTAAIASGELKVSYAGRTVEYRSIDELIRARDVLRGDLGRLSSNGVQRSRIIKTTVLM
ncbi:hypothetical protein PbB2_00086 [Candidatus Phycosocius bacilliformis]|uniref:GpW protein n=1 Tax=Candidatus Phycosocius bacilliformis TaxID=1445552 RepID=A0A2P2E5U0_9PROT|nr:hypothetical protein [Candidatus Phycosocius bacilliformis]GBF56430.1 hypothetical protein PbB2_00086 [Candidatus Phycosocius bacilliformis]